MHSRLVTAAVLAAALAPHAPAAADLPPLIPREVLFGVPAADAPALSPDGAYIAYTAPDSAGVSNIFVRALGDAPSAARAATAETRDIYGFQWAPDSRHLLFRQDVNGDETYHLVAAELATGVVRDLTPWRGVRVEGLHTDVQHPDELLVGLNLRDRRAFDMYRVNLVTGAVTFDTQNPGDVIDWTVDSAFRIRACTALDPADASMRLRVRDTPEDAWREIAHWPLAAVGSDRVQKILGFTPDGRLLYVNDPAGANTSRLVTMDPRDGRVVAVLAHDERCDFEEEHSVTGMSPPKRLEDPRTGAIQAIAVEYLLPDWIVLDHALAPDFAFLRAQHPGELGVLSRSADDATWLVGYWPDSASNAYYTYDRRARTLALVFVAQPALNTYTLASMTPFPVRAPDGLDIPCYLTLPAGGPAHGLPMVVVPHGGPWARTWWGYDAEAQWLANRGYAVLHVNFRSSTGFGRALLNAGDREFGPGKVLGDILAATRAAIDSGIVDPKRVGIYGGSFGGYATLCGLVFSPETYACGVDLVGPSDIKTLFASFPAYWGPRLIRWKVRFGDPTTDAALNARISPLTYAANIRAPLLIGHGVNDPRVSLANSEKLVAAMRERKLPVTFVVYPDEGHGFVRTPNSLDFYARMEEFLAAHLGGRLEPRGEFPGTTAEVR